MEILKFTIRGDGALFKRPSFNTIYSSYEHIHKPCILGILGALIGLGKYKLSNIPFSYLELEDLEIGIVPKQIIFPKYKYLISDTSGNSYSKKIKNYKKKVAYTTIIETEELVSPEWDIYIKYSKNQYFNLIKNALEYQKYIYIPYLGCNTYRATINDFSIIEGTIIEKSNLKINSLFQSENCCILSEDEEEYDSIYAKWYLPICYNKRLMQYIEKQFTFTNNDVIIHENCSKYINCNNKIIYFI